MNQISKHFLHGKSCLALLQQHLPLPPSNHTNKQALVEHKRTDTLASSTSETYHSVRLMHLFLTTWTATHDLHTLTSTLAHYLQQLVTATLTEYKLYSIQHKAHFLS